MRRHGGHLTCGYTCVGHRRDRRIGHHVADISLYAAVIARRSLLHGALEPCAFVVAIRAVREAKQVGAHATIRHLTKSRHRRTDPVE